MSNAPSTIVCPEIGGTLFKFAKKGDVLARHRHGDLDVHTTHVGKGTFLARWWDEKGLHTKVLGPGAYVNWPSGIDHEIEALEDESGFLNIVKRQ